MDDERGTVLTRRTDRVLTVTVANPKRRNAISLTMFHELTAAVRAADADRDARVMILRGAGTTAFTAGVELSAERVDGPAWSQVEAAAAQTFAALDAIRIPVIAQVHGYCLGGGVALALAADLRIATADATFAIPAARLGVGYPPQQVARLTALIGPANAAEMLYTANRLNAAEALACGLVNRVVDSVDDAAAVVGSLANAIADNAPVSIRAAKAAIRAAHATPDSRLVSAAERAAEACARSRDFQEGLGAFVQRRAPVFTGD
ncbi:enoyl-CoA hydratase-related protein [Mycolicibacterium sp. CBM1]